MTQGAYDHQHRLLVCQNCGASLSVGMEGGQVSCRYCNAVSVWRPRTEVHDIASLRQAPPMDEYERFRRLREQEGKPLLPPPGLEHLVVAGGLPQQLLPQATTEWQGTLRQVAAGAPFGVHDRLYFLTLLLYSRLSSSGDELRARGIVESALETLPSPQHRYLLRAKLSRSATRQGDLASAEAWLAGCDARSQDLEVDTEYRMSAANIATRKGDFAAVLSLFGERPEDVPVALSASLPCGMLRANALERTGRLPQAISQLEALAQKHGVDDLAEVKKVNAALDLCPRSFAAIEARQQAAAGGRGPGQPGDPIAQAAAMAKKSSAGISLLIGGIFSVIGVGMIVGGFFVSPHARTDDDMMPLNYFLWGLGGFFVVMGVGGGIAQNLFMGKVMGAIGAGLGGSSGPDASWKKASGQVVSARPTGWTINDLPQLEVRVRVFFEQHPPYEVDVKVCVPEYQVPQIQPNTSLGLLVNPANPTEVSVSRG